MPAPSDLAARLADDLVEVGRMLGFQAQKEHPIKENSKFRVDVLWKIAMPEESPFPNVNLASIEIQYSDSVSSISHGIFKAEKTIHPSVHVVISYFELSADYIDNVLKANYPTSGLVIINGEKDVRRLNLWITRFLAIKDEGTRLEEKGRRIRDFAISRLPESEAEIGERVRENFQSDIKKIFLPPEIKSLLKTFVEIESRGVEYDRAIIDDVFRVFIDFVQERLQKYNIPRVHVSVDLLFTELNIEPEFKDSNVDFQDSIEITQSDILVRDTNDYPLEVIVHNGNAYIESVADTMCVEALNADDIVHFITRASEEIESQISRYRISNDDKKRLHTIKDALG